MSLIKSISRILSSSSARKQSSIAPELHASVERPDNPTPLTQMQKNTQIALHPKILAVGMDPGIVKGLSDKGLMVQDMDLGHPYFMEASAAILPVPSRAPFPEDYKEHDIVVVNLTEPFLPLGDAGEVQRPSEEITTWWFDCRQGMVNTRLLYGESARNSFDVILEHGGLFVIFVDSYMQQDFFVGHLDRRNNVDVERKFTGSNYDFLTALNVPGGVQFSPDQGTVVTLSEGIRGSNVLGKALVPFLENVKFSCKLVVGYRYKECCLPILQNKFGDVVGAILSLDKGHILMLPNFEDKGAVLNVLFNDVFPFLKPELFPNHKSASWKELPEYEINRVIELKNEIDEVQKQAELAVEKLNCQIEEQRKQHQYLFDLVGETGENLVEAVKRALATLGFKNVVDADAELAQKGVIRQNLEDLQIHDTDATILVEIKGISGFPSDDDALAVRKYVTLRMKEWKRFNVKALTIINHQRNLPPLTRGNDLPFRKELIDIGVAEDIGFMTAWDLHRLVRSFVANRWRHEHIRPIFLRNGRVDVIPAQYEKIGVVQRYIKSASILGIELFKDVSIGDKLGYDLPTFYKEEECESLQLNQTPVNAATAGNVVGVRTTLTADEVKLGMTVYRVNRGQSSI